MSKLTKKQEREFIAQLKADTIFISLFCDPDTKYFQIKKKFKSKVTTTWWCQVGPNNIHLQELDTIVGAGKHFYVSIARLQTGIVYAIHCN